MISESLGEFVREQAVLRNGQTAAVWFEQGVEITYRQLDASADRLASSLLARGVRKGCHVAVMLPNVPAFPLTWIALGRVGAVMVPVNTAYTSEELHFVLVDSDAQFLVIDKEYLARFEEIGDPLPLLDTGRVFVHGDPRDGYTRWEDLEASGAAPFEAPVPIARTDLLNLQYTSGTTGFPKGCMLSHDYWMLHAHGSARNRCSSKGTIRHVLIWAPFFYMDPMWQFLMTLKLGGTVYIARRMSLTRFPQWLRDFQIDYCIFPEPMLRQHPPSPSDGETCLKYISIYDWTETARKEVQERFDVVAREGYGMTEIGTGLLMPQEAAGKALTRSCGLPAPFREFRIRNVDDGADTPDGEIGELWVAGRALSLGYYKRPSANAQSYDGRWFRTGDLFRRDADGYYYIVGRIKEMIKRAGENVAANEVEAVLRSMPEVEEAAVIAVQDSLRKEEVKAYIKLAVGHTPETVPPEALLEHCARSLAAFKVPRYIQYVAEFPHTPSRKIAKKALIAQKDDLISGAFDRQEGRWR